MHCVHTYIRMYVSMDYVLQDITYLSCVSCLLPRPSMPSAFSEPNIAAALLEEHKKTAMYSIKPTPQHKIHSNYSHQPLDNPYSPNQAEGENSECLATQLYWL